MAEMKWIEWELNHSWRRRADADWRARTLSLSSFRSFRFGRSLLSVPWSEYFWHCNTIPLKVNVKWRIRKRAKATLNDSLYGKQGHGLFSVIRNVWPPPPTPSLWEVTSHTNTHTFKFRPNILVLSSLHALLEMLRCHLFVFFTAL